MAAQMMKDQALRPPIDAAPWSDWEVASLCIVGRLTEAVTKEGVKHPLLGEWHRARRAFADAAVDGRPAPHQRARLRTVTEKIRQAFAQGFTERGA
jgi:hypothetical protein